jgi:hypothetical protein
MFKKILSIAIVILCSSGAFAQKGQVWPTETRQEFDIGEDGKITKEYEVVNYPSYYLFINNNEFIHCTGTITSLYKILKRNEGEGMVDYDVISEAGNQYTFRFSTAENYVVISTNKGYSIYMACKPYYTTTVFDNLNR